MTVQPVEPSKILDMKFDKEDVVFYVVNFLPFLILMVALPVIFTVSRIIIPGNDTNSMIKHGVLMLICNLIIFAISIVASRVIAIIGKRKYNGYVKKYGYENLEAQLKEINNTVFYIHPEKYESYVIITREYLVFSRTMIIRLNEIRQIRFSRISKGDTKRPYQYSKRAAEITRFIRKVYIVNEHGLEENYPVALSDEEYYALVNFLAYRLGPNIVYYNN